MILPRTFFLLVNCKNFLKITNSLHYHFRNLSGLKGVDVEPLTQQIKIGLSWNCMSIFHFPKITPKRSGFPKIQEISFKVETLTCAIMHWRIHHTSAVTEPTCSLRLVVKSSCLYHTWVFPQIKGQVVNTTIFELLRRIAT